MNWIHKLCRYSYGHCNMKNSYTHAKIWVRTQKYRRARKNIDTHAKIWVCTQKYGYAHKNMDTHVKIWTRKNLRCTKILKVQKYSTHRILWNVLEFYELKPVQTGSLISLYGSYFKNIKLIFLKSFHS